MESVENQILHLSPSTFIVTRPLEGFWGFFLSFCCFNPLLIKCAAIAILQRIRRHRPVHPVQGHDQHPEQGRWPRIPRVCSPLCSISVPSQLPPAAAAKGACSSTEDPLCTQEAAEGVCTGGCDRHCTQVCVAQQQQTERRFLDCRGADSTFACRSGTSPKMAVSQIGLVGLAVMGQVSRLSEPTDSTMIWLSAECTDSKASPAEHGAQRRRQGLPHLGVQPLL